MIILVQLIKVIQQPYKKLKITIKIILLFSFRFIPVVQINLKSISYIYHNHRQIIIYALNNLLKMFIINTYKMPYKMLINIIVRTLFFKDEPPCF